MFKVMRDTPPIPETLSLEGKDFLRCCFKRNPAERPPAAVLLEHRFLKISHQPDLSSPTQLYNGTSFMVNVTGVSLLCLPNHALWY
uniref:Protein kinase domain-containing protein n=2 Tax=Lotus japonicus TaxID=34305 RepID=I3SA22_LOTJA|nr:unknown [Lotus japonicus]